MLSTSDIPARGCTPSVAATTCDHRVVVARRGELAEPRAVGERGKHLGRDLRREAGLADATDAGERHEPRTRRSAVAEPGELFVATDERRELHRQVAAERVERPQRREVGAGDPAAQSWNTRSARARSRSRCSPRSTRVQPSGSASRTQLLGRERDHDLPAVRDRP